MKRELESRGRINQPYWLYEGRLHGGKRIRDVYSRLSDEITVQKELDKKTIIDAFSRLILTLKRHPAMK